MQFATFIVIQALELARIQESTKQKEFDAKIAEYNAHVESSKLDAVRLAAEERKKLLQEEAKIGQQKAQYEDQLARKRYFTISLCQLRSRIEEGYKCCAHDLKLTLIRNL